MLAVASDQVLVERTPARVLVSPRMPFLLEPINFFHGRSNFRGQGRRNRPPACRRFCAQAPGNDLECPPPRSNREGEQLFVPLPSSCSSVLQLSTINSQPSTILIRIRPAGKRRRSANQPICGQQRPAHHDQSRKKINPNKMRETGTKRRYRHRHRGQCLIQED